jgi:hypothetical protein
MGCGAGGRQQVPRSPAAGVGMTRSLGARQQDRGSVETKVNVKGSGRECPFHTSRASLRSADSRGGCLHMS